MNQFSEEDRMLVIYAIDVIDRKFPNRLGHETIVEATEIILETVIQKKNKQIQAMLEKGYPPSSPAIRDIKLLKLTMKIQRLEDMLARAYSRCQELEQQWINNRSPEGGKAHFRDVIYKIETTTIQEQARELVRGIE